MSGDHPICPENYEWEKKRLPVLSTVPATINKNIGTGFPAYGLYPNKIQ